MRRQSNDSTTLATSVFIGANLLLMLFLAFSWGNSLLKQANIDRQIKDFQQENERVARENLQLEEQFRYLQSPQYRDKWAKQHEGLAQPGEAVIVIEFRPHSLEPDFSEDAKLLEREILLSQPNREQWKVLFFGDE